MAALLSVSGCRNPDATDAVPPRATDTIDYPPQSSVLSVPIGLKLDTLRTALEREVPRNLYALRKHVDRCVPPQRIKIFKKRIPVTPKLGCDVAISVSRGPLRLSGAGQEITIAIPIYANARASNVAGVLYETARGSALANVRIRLRLQDNWRLAGSARIAYAWTTPPNMVVLGQRITFTDKVDQQLGPIVARFERTLPNELAKVDVRKIAGEAWREAFAVLQLNRQNPPVWMRITPQKLMYGGYSVNGANVKLSLGMEAATETFVGTQPQPNPPIPLPAFGKLTGPVGNASLFVPVIADYSEIEPVILKALVKRSQRPFDIPRVGPVQTRFDKVEAYATDGGRVAVGLTLRAWPQASPAKAISGRLWLTAVLINPVNTRTLSFRDLHVTGETDRWAGSLLLKVVNHPSVSAEVANALTQHLERDYEQLRGKIDRAIVERKEGDFVFRAAINDMRSGSLKATGQGLFLPVWATGTAEVTYAPRL